MAFGYLLRDFVDFVHVCALYVLLLQTNQLGFSGAVSALCGELQGYLASHCTVARSTVKQAPENHLRTIK